jgi:hypothetical protein
MIRIEATPFWYFPTMKQTLILSSLLLSSFALAESNQPPAGFTPLFNGTDLSGWYGWGTKDPSELWAMTPEQLADYKKKSIEGGLPEGKQGAENILAHWKVENGELVNDGKGLYLTTDKDYGDFELLVDYKALPKGDSGIYLRGIPQVQIWDPAEADPQGLGRALGSGGLWNNSKGAPGKDPLKKMDLPLGEWNTFRIKMIGERVTITLNGEKVVDNAVLENFFANRKAGYLAYGKPKVGEAPKTEKMPNGFMRDPAFAQGPIQLQTHGSEIRWRNVFIREISSDEANAALSEQNAEGFERLDNGKDLSNWQGAVANYEVADGNIVCKPGKGGDLLSKEEYGDVLIRFEFKLPLGGNNGIALRTPLGGHSASDGLELQVIDNDGYNAKSKTPLKDYQVHGSLYHCVGAKTGYLRKVGEWNYQEIEVKGQRIKVTLNGTKILDVDIDALDRTQIKSPPKGLDRKTGHIGFAGHSDPVAFRNFRVKRL